MPRASRAVGSGSRTRSSPSGAKYTSVHVINDHERHDRKANAGNGRLGRGSLVAGICSIWASVFLLFLLLNFEQVTDSIDGLASFLLSQPSDQVQMELN